MVVEIHSEKREMDSKLHPIDPGDPYVKFILCYPKHDCEEFSSRVKELLDWGISNLVELGKNILGFRVLGKGYSSIATLAYRGCEKGFLKIRRLDSRRASLEFEGLILDFLDRFNIVPKPMFYSKNFVFMEYLDDCIPIGEFIDKSQNNIDYNSLIKTIAKTTYTLYIPDFYGINHSELSRPGDHIYICRNGVRIIDWESATIKSKPNNVSSFISYLTNRPVVRRKLSNRVLDELIHALRMYKKTYSIKKLQSVVRILVESLQQPP
ncbi:MAG: hypothetical protein QXO78_01885 [Desulfurococcaceae archaeon]